MYSQFMMDGQKNIKLALLQFSHEVRNEEDCTKKSLCA